MGIPGISEAAPQRPTFVNHRDELSAGQGLSAKSIQLVKDVAALLGADASVRIFNRSAVADVGMVGSAAGTGVPALDNPNDPEVKEVDLEKLIAYLQLETDKKQTELAKQRIGLQESEIEARHESQRAKLQESLDEMDEAAKANKRMKLFGWLMAAVAVVFAVAASVATGGLAIGALAGAGMAITMAALNQCDVISNITENLSDFLKDKLGFSDLAAKIVAAVAVTTAMIVICVATGAGAASFASHFGIATKTGAMVATSTLQSYAQMAQGGLDVALKGLGLAGVGLGIHTGYKGYEAGMSQADVSESKKFLEMMRQQLEESQEELKALLEQIQGVYADIVAILNSEVDTQREIAKNIGSMA